MLITLIEMSSNPVQVQDLAIWARLLLGYSKAARILDKAYVGCIHPQRRPALRTALAAALGRILEIRGIMLGLPGEPFAAAITAAARELKMTPPDYELAVPLCFLERRSLVKIFRNISTSTASDYCLQTIFLWLIS